MIQTEQRVDCFFQLGNVAFLVVQHVDRNDRAKQNVFEKRNHVDELSGEVQKERTEHRHQVIGQPVGKFCGERGDVLVCRLLHLRVIRQHFCGKILNVVCVVGEVGDDVCDT